MPGTKCGKGKTCQWKSQEMGLNYNTQDDRKTKKMTVEDRPPLARKK